MKQLAKVVAERLARWRSGDFSALLEETLSATRANFDGPRSRDEATPPDAPYLPERVVGLVKRTVREGGRSKGAELIFDHAPHSVGKWRSR